MCLRSPVCVLLCRAKWPSVVKDRPHVLHACFLLGTTGSALQSTIGALPNSADAGGVGISAGRENGGRTGLGPAARWYVGRPWRGGRAWPGPEALTPASRLGLARLEGASVELVRFEAAREAREARETREGAWEWAKSKGPGTERGEGNAN